MHNSAVFEYIATTICFCWLHQPSFLLLLLVGFLIIGNYTAASVEKCGLNSNTCVVFAVVLTSPSISTSNVINCLLCCVCESAGESVHV